jgi:hypothetical protein
MGCLVEITLRSSVDSCEKKDRFFKRHSKFFMANQPTAEEERAGRDVIRIFVPWGENRTSQYLCERMCRDRSVFKAKIIS